jgi:hypothetical protein
MKDFDNEIQESLKKSSQLNAKTIDIFGKDIHEDIKSTIKTYSDNIRNLSIISATTAPFSLTLLQVDNLVINSYILITSFCILLFNLALSQIFLNMQTVKDDLMSFEKEKKLLFAEFDLWSMSDNTKSYLDRATKNFDFNQKISEINNLDSRYNLSIQENRSKLRKYNKISNILFLVGILLIVFSVIYYPMVNFIFC